MPDTAAQNHFFVVSPRISTVGRTIARIALSVASGFVPFESLIKVTPFTVRTNSMRCSTPGKFEAYWLLLRRYSIQTRESRCRECIFEVMPPGDTQFLRRHNISLFRPVKTNDSVFTYAPFGGTVDTLNQTTFALICGSSSLTISLSKFSTH